MHHSIDNYNPTSVFEQQEVTGMTGMPKTLSVAEFARSAGITKKYAFDLTQSGRLGATKDERGRWVISSDALNAFMRLRKARLMANVELASLAATQRRVAATA